MAKYAIAQFNFPLITSESASKTRKQRKTTPKILENNNGFKDVKVRPSKIIAVVSSSMKLANDAIGLYTGNKMRKSNMSTVIGASTLLMTSLFNPYIALGTATAYTIKRTIDLSIEQKISQEQADFKKSYMGNMTTNGSRWRRN